MDQEKTYKFLSYQIMRIYHILNLIIAQWDESILMFVNKNTHIIQCTSISNVRQFENHEFIAAGNYDCN